MLSDDRSKKKWAGRASSTRAVAQFQDRSRARLYAMDSEELGMVNAGAVVVSQTATPPILAAEEVVLE